MFVRTIGTALRAGSVWRARFRGGPSMAAPCLRGLYPCGGGASDPLVSPGLLRGGLCLPGRTLRAVASRVVSRGQEPREGRARRASGGLAGVAVARAGGGRVAVAGDCDCSVVRACSEVFSFRGVARAK